MSLFKRYFNKKAYDAEKTVIWSEELPAPSKGLFLKRFKKHKLALFGFWFLVAVAICAIFAPLLAPYEQNEMSAQFSAAPSMEHWLGTDQVGRDVLSRLIYAARVSLMVGLFSIAIAAVIGTVLGLLAGYFGGIIDGIIMRITDVFMSFPYIIFILVVASIVGPGLTNIIIILGVLGWPSIARLVRGNVLALKQSDYVKASVALGYSTPRILFKHILPNTVAPILIYATSGVAGAILDEAALSFLGLGVQPPDASWGNMLSSAQSISILTDLPWLWIPAGLMILFTVLSVNYIGDALRDALDPRNTK
ncbi:oligopeptide ABC transporter permease [Kurthia sibirica]|uniref:Peptide ABC transporter permease n=1 Tax=Kurthia sibirica TaxID=202750 RepID=A0A2U3AJK8_9BACL|nr:oligopeptide ABC transporter permease [Kurthia sibirica]PWI24729.1 peptide ABC transporter permease [Kurthia sibirica]GEK34759.1 oligopeptide transport system permease protein AppC [Kurthia sibirica]